MRQLYKEHRVFSHLGNSRIAMYVCLERIDDGLFSVHMAQFFNASTIADLSKDLAAAELTSVELLSETEPSERCQWHSSIGEAIDAHDHEFDNGF
jgi:hypothetical protein